MNMYKEEDYLSLSGIQHYAFCRRQWALIHIEQQWEDNLRTVEGNILHRNAHNSFISQKRGDIISSKGMPIYSRILGVYGECDVVEFHKDEENGVSLFGRVGKYNPVPIEYKHGEPKNDDIDMLQLTAQAICLEEMLCCEIKAGYIFYEKIKHRLLVNITPDLRTKVHALFNEMHEVYQRRYTPKVKRTKACNACSLKDICLPVLNKNKSAREYINHFLEEN